VWWVAFDPSLGGEIRKTRPAIVVSNDATDAALNRLQVVPLTSRVDHLYPAKAYVTHDGQRRKAMADQIATVGRQRLRGRLSRLAATDVAAVERAIRVQLNL
jgi:mRNA interferase MazF